MDGHSYLLSLERGRLVEENHQLQLFILALAERIAVQSELLAMSAERTAPGSAGGPSATEGDR